MDMSVVVVRAAVAVAACAWLPAFADIEIDMSTDASLALSLVPQSRQCTLDAGDDGEVPTADASGGDAPRLVPLSPKALYEPMVEQTAQMYGLESALLHAVIFVESRYDAKAVSKQGARGLMQLMPGTARRYDVADALDPAQNLRGGARYLRDLLVMFHNDLRLVLAAYNAGEAAVIRNGYRIPPLKQTLEYVPRVLGLYRRYLRAEVHEAVRIGDAR